MDKETSLDMINGVLELNEDQHAKILFQEGFKRCWRNVENRMNNLLKVMDMQTSTIITQYGVIGDLLNSPLKTRTEKRAIELLIQIRNNQVQGTKIDWKRWEKDAKDIDIFIGGLGE